MEISGSFIIGVGGVLFVFFEATPSNKDDLGGEN